MARSVAGILLGVLLLGLATPASAHHREYRGIEVDYSGAECWLTGDPDGATFDGRIAMFEDRRDVTGLRYRREIWKREPGQEWRRGPNPRILEVTSTDGVWSHIGISGPQMLDGKEYKLVYGNTWIRPDKPDIRHSNAAAFFPTDDCY